MEIIMKVSELKTSLEKEIKSVTGKKGTGIVFSAGGSIGTRLAKDIIATIEELEKRIVILEEKASINKRSINKIESKPEPPVFKM
jgi:hypothetical protein